MIQDFQQRQTALEADKSFIVQAPAGSGKTGLLVYRMLVLLATVERPENVLAITFTRKATSEMRQRLLEMLQMAETGQTSTDTFEQQGIDLAGRVLAQDKRYDWQLLNTPYQLQILTIDAFCGKLTGHMPWLSRLGDKPRTTDNADVHYAAAVEQLFNELLGEPSELSDNLKTVLLELDFNYSRARKLFSAILGRRDQWLRHLLQHDLLNMRETIELSWRSIRDQHIAKLEALLPQTTLQHLCQIAVKASALIDVKEGELSPLCVFESYQLDTPLKLEHWRALKFLLLTDKGTYRKAPNKNQGFPSKDEHKQSLIDLLAELADDEDLREVLQQVDALTDGQFADADWQQLLALENVLKSLAAFLQLRFRASNECDHSEVTQRANLALQELANPTDLALRLDYQIKHILVDEFQDTSHAQLQLLKTLTVGWGLDDESRTLFLVGDPMQSIYRFREADVGLFLQVVQNHSSKVFDNIDIQALRLTENFRSTSSLVDWFNTTFSKSFPKTDQVLDGAICYAHSTCSGDGSDTSIVVTLLAEDKQQESQLVVKAIQDSMQELSVSNEDTKIAVLVRSRSHLKTLIPAIQQAGIAYEGVDIQPLQESQAVIDVLALCKAINHLDDRVAWLALLRGPWCGLSLTQIKVVAAHQDLTIWEQVSQNHRDSFDAETQRRLTRFCDVMRHALEHRHQFGLHRITRWAWQSLGGKNTLFGLSVDDVESVFTLIEQCQRGGNLLSISELERSLAGLYAQPQKAVGARVIISTMHKAKGLQYDTVILPGLSNQPRSEQKDILMWAEHQSEQGDAQLLLAPIQSSTNKTRSVADKNDSNHYEYLRELEKRRSTNEAVRLMYVACTRAERKLYLIARANIDQKTEELKAPDKRTLLATVWEPLETKFELQMSSPSEQLEQDSNLDQTLMRLPNNFTVSFADAVKWQPRQQLQSQTETPEQQVDFEWATEVAAAVGMVMHEWLQFNHSSLFNADIGDDQYNAWRAQWVAQLRALNVRSERIGFALQRLQKGLENIRSDSAAKFLFADYDVQKNEFEIAAFENGLVNKYRIDRTFIDHEDVRWIVDYKTTDTRAEDLDHFVEQQIAERHKAQLEKYGSLMSEIDAREIKLAVYFPMLAKLSSWNYQR